MINGLITCAIRDALQAILSELSYYLISLFDPSYILHNLVDSVTSPSKFKGGQLLSLHIHIETRVVLLTDSNYVVCKLGHCAMQKLNRLNQATMSQSVSIQSPMLFLKPLGHIPVHKR